MGAADRVLALTLPELRLCLWAVREGLAVECRNRIKAARRARRDPALDILPLRAVRKHLHAAGLRLGDEQALRRLDQSADLPRLHKHRKPTSEVPVEPTHDRQPHAHLSPG
jgi:hypothetical protein